MATALSRLESGPLHSFDDPLDPDVPVVAAGCYTIWDQAGTFVYAGMAGRGLSAEKIAEARRRPSARPSGLRDRLNAHRSGRRSGDQFGVYVFDRFILPKLTREEIVAAGNGSARLDETVRQFIQQQLSYRWAETTDGSEALRIETVLVTDGLSETLPLLNPKKVE